MKPVRLFLSPRGKAALSPRKTTPENYRETNQLNIQSRLKPHKLSYSHSPINKTKLFPPLLQVNDRTSLKIDTPQKREIAENGLKDVSKHVEILGKGCFGTVLRGVQKHDPVAIKVVPISKTGYLNESNVIGLCHENIVKTIDVNLGSNYGCVIMECVNAVKLSDILHKNKVEISKHSLIGYAVDLCKGLKFCHENSILHLDIKPSNVVVTEEGICKICDFGNSMKIGSEKKFVNQGSPAYAAPELFTGSVPSEKCDVYSLGVTMWEIENREVPYENIENSEVLIYKVVKFQERPKNSNHALFGGIYERCWQSVPNKRPNLDCVAFYLQQNESPIGSKA